MIPRPPRHTRTDPLLPVTTLFRSRLIAGEISPAAGGIAIEGNVAMLRQTVQVGEDETIADLFGARAARALLRKAEAGDARSEEHTSELQSLMRISYAVFCLKKKNTLKNKKIHIISTINQKIH